MKRKFLWAALLFLPIAALGISCGAASIPLQELLQPQNRQILLLRVFRVLLAASAGIGLSVSGVALQAVLRNPLAEPYLLGTSSGAGLGAVIAIALCLPQPLIPALALAGAIASIAVVYALAQQQGRLSEESLILSGVITSVACSAVMVFIISLAANPALREAVWWLWGSLQAYNPRLFIFTAAMVLSGSAIIYYFAQDLNAISLGEEEAVHLGVDAQAVKKIVIFASALVTAAIVCSCGIIGFVGLILPHMSRLVCGPNHRSLIPFSCIAAASFMVACDIIARVALPPVEIPMGVITALVGAPVFIILLRREQKA
jgi:iron complex transport system permease protein